MTTWPYWPRPPVWRMNLPSTSSARFRGCVSRYATCGPADVGVDLELAAQAVDDDLQVELAHAADDRLARLRIGEDAERRVLVGELLPSAIDELVLVGLGLRLDRDRR